jgi:quercetin dioxygenase-like cupin family protein
MSGKMDNETTYVRLTCADIKAALDWYTDDGGLRIDTIFPADAPREAELSTEGLKVTLEAATDQPVPVSEPALLVTRKDDAAFGTGRAGMQYRDLIPGRFGGRFIASHIRIPEGGPVPDYVHHHDIEFQMIFCVNGWVLVAYENQGEPMRMKAGDCFLQPPHIRHRVLECSDGMEVVEITCPAEHETSVDHELALPTATIDRERLFGGQRFVFHQSGEAPWHLSDIKGARYQNLRLAEATGGTVSAIVIEANEAGGRIPLLHNGELRFLYIMAGDAEFAGGKEASLVAGDSVAVPADCDVALNNVSSDFKALEVDVPRQTPGR